MSISLKVDTNVMVFGGVMKMFNTRRYAFDGEALAGE